MEGSMSSTEPLRTVVLRGGLTASLPALRLLWDLEARGFRREQDGKLSIGPRACITPDDDEAIRAHRDELLTLIRYCDEVRL
jgi:hypothetical protein